MNKLLILILGILLICCKKQKDVIFQFDYPSNVPLNYDDCGLNSLSIDRIYIYRGRGGKVIENNKPDLNLDSNYFNNNSEPYQLDPISLIQGIIVQIQMKVPAKSTNSGYRLLIPNIYALVDNLEYVVQEYDTVIVQNDCLYSPTWFLP